ncbi:hypothetical protein F5B20DRAFT_247524 [Whalleya microplaca]|nr:hypothetical protein F5B20DRAFT_247524 [Whalleya microplaca]
MSTHRSLLFRFLLLLLMHTRATIAASPDASVTAHRVVETTLASTSTRNRNRTMGAPQELRFRAITTQMSTCGYYNGDPSKVRTADSGYNCRVDITKGLWGFCPTTVISARDCGLAGACIDRASCSKGCGILGDADVTTFSCTETGAPLCSTALLDSGVDQTYSYIACGPAATTDTLLAVATSPSTSSTTTSSAASSSSDSTPGSSPGSSTTSPTSPASVASEATDTAQAQPMIATSTPNTGAIIGGVIGGLALVCGTVLAVVFLLRRGRRKRQEAQEVAGVPTTQSVLGKDYTASNVSQLMWNDNATQPGYQLHLSELEGENGHRQQRPGEVAELASDR